MKFNTKITVSGIKSSKGTLENGNTYDSTKLYVLTDLDDSKGTAKGSSTVEYSFGTSEEFQKLKHLPLPFDAEAELEIVTTGRTQKTQIVSVKPIAHTKTADKSPAKA